MSRPLTFRFRALVAGLVALVVASAMASAGASSNRLARPAVGEPVVLLSVPAPRPNGSVADQLELNYSEVHYLTLDLNDLLSHLVTSVQPAVVDPDVSCQSLVPRDNAIAVAGMTISFGGVEARLCDPGSGTFVGWHGQCRNADDDVLGFVSLSVLLDESGSPTGATGTIGVGTVRYELMPVEGDTYALYRLVGGPVEQVCGLTAVPTTPLQATPHVDPNAAASPAAPVHAPATLTG